VSNRTEDLKGRAKQAAGDLTGDKDLQIEGKADRASASAKDAVDTLKEKVTEGVESARGKAEELRGKGPSSS
jgi:uncharacterized protein YjbJ (UPF0337 family)